MVPLCAVIIFFAIANPRPVPSFLWVMKGSNKQGICSCGMGSPLLAIFMVKISAYSSVMIISF